MKRVVVCITARPSYGRIKTALTALKAKCDLQIITAASANLEMYGNVADTMDCDGLSPVERLYTVVQGGTVDTMVKTTSLTAMELSSAFRRLRPDMVVTIADRAETLATAIAASYQNVPLCHIQGGEVTGSIDDRVRNAVTMLADLHCVSTEHAQGRVAAMREPESGEGPWYSNGPQERQHVVVTGCPSIDLAKEALEDKRPLGDPQDRYGGVGADLDLSKGYIVVMQHPVTTEWTEARHQIEETLYAVDHSGLQALWFWPNPDAGTDATSTGIRAYRETHHPKRIRFFKGMEPHDFLRLLIGSRAIVGNSSVALRECSYLGVPAVNIGSRQQGRERAGNVLDIPHDRKQITQALLTQINREHFKPSTLYGDGSAGERIANAITAY